MSLMVLGSVGGGKVVPGAGGVPSGFQLDAGQYVDEFIPAKIIAPRPDAERSTNSRYSYAYPGIEYEVPIKVLGGSYPFLFEITARSGTADVANATIEGVRTYTGGRDWYGSENHKNYGVLRWTPDAGDDGSTFSFTVKITGQDGVTASVTFTGTVQASKFIFVQDGASPGGDGTLATPFEDNSDWWGADGTDATYAGKFVYYRAGNYEAFPSSVFSTNKPLVYLDYPGDGYWVLDGTAKDYSFANSGMHDFWWQGSDINGTPGTGVSNCRMFGGGTSTADFDRGMFWKNRFRNGQVGSVGTDNNGWIVFLRAGTSNHKYCVIADNIFDTANSSSNGFEAFTFFSFTEWLFEGNVCKNYTGEYIAQAKDGVNTFSVRANDMWEGNTPGACVSMTNQSDGSITNDTQEVCWNYLWNSDTTAGLCVGMNSQEDAGVDVSPVWVYRNTMRSDSKVCTDIRSKLDGAETELDYIKNIMVADDNPHTVRNDSTPIDTSGSTDAEAAAYLVNARFDNIFQTVITDLIDADGALTGSGRTSYLSEYGAEIK